MNNSAEQVALSVPRKKRKMLNRSFLLGSLVFLAVGAGLTFLWYRYQTGRLAASLLERADSRAAEGDFRGAAEYLHRYLQAYPDDTTVRLRLAETFDKSAADLASKRRAVELYYEAIARSKLEQEKVGPEREKKLKESQEMSARCRLAQVLFDMAAVLSLESLERIRETFAEANPREQFAAAEKQAGLVKSWAETAQSWAEKQLQAAPNDSQLESLLAESQRLMTDAQRLWALALCGQARLRGSAPQQRNAVSPARAVKDALQLQRSAPAKNLAAILELTRILAKIYRDEPALLAEEQRDLSKFERAAEADRLMDAMIDAFDKDATAWLSQPAHRALGRYQWPQHALEIEARLARYAYRRNNKLPGAEDDLQFAIATNEKPGKNEGQTQYEFGPEDFELLLAKAGLEQAEAERLQREKGSQKETWQAHCAAAAALLQEAVRVKPVDPRAHLALANIYLAQGKSELAVAACDKGLQHNPSSASLNLMLVAIQTRQGDFAGAAKTLRALDQLSNKVVQVAAKGSARARREKASLERAIAMQRAAWHLAQGQYAQAVPLIRQAASSEKASDAQRAESFQASISLGGAFAAMDQWDRAAIAYEEAIKLLPQMPNAYLPAAQAQEKLGRYEQAANYCEKALAIHDDPEARLLLARARLELAVQNVGQQPDWEAMDKLLASLAQPKADQQPLKDPWRVKLLEAEYLWRRAQREGKRQEGIEEATARLRNAENAFPNAAGLMQMLVFAYEALGAKADAERVLARFKELTDNSVAAVLVASRLALVRNDVERARAVLDEGLKSAPQEKKSRLELERILVALEAQQDDDAKQRMKTWLNEVRSKQDEAALNNAAVRTLVIRITERAFEHGSLSDVEDWENELKSLEGPDGTFWRQVRARRLLALAKTVADPNFSEAEKLQEEIRKLRPSWSAGQVLRAFILQRRGRFEEALDAYKEAIRLGDRRVAISERLVALLYQLNRFSEAEQYLADLKGAASGSALLSSLEISEATRQGQWEHALQAARRAVAVRPNDPQAHIWLGRMLLADNDPRQAEAAFREAVRVSPAGVEASYALLFFLARSNQPDRIRELLAEVDKNEKIPAGGRKLLLAYGYELIGDPAAAKASCRELLALAADTAAVRTRVAAQVARFDPEQAEAALRRALQLEPRYGPARHLLAGILADRGGQKEWEEAIALLQDTPRGEQDAGLRELLRAALLARRGGPENLRQARQIAQELLATSAEPRAALLLVRIYEAEGDLSNARETCLGLVNRANSSPAHLAVFVDMLLRHGRTAEAEPWLQKLEKAAPDNLGAVTLRARWLEQSGRSGQIEPLVEKFGQTLLGKISKNPQQELQVDYAIGTLYSAVRLHPLAERWYRRALEKSPEQFQPLALCLARQGRTADAIRCCAQAWDKDPSPRVIVALESVLAFGKPSAKDFQLAEPMLAKAREIHGKNAAVLNAQANIRVFAERLEEAIELYREVLKLRPKDVPAMNNLASVLAELPDRRGEAIQIIDQAIALVGPQPLLMDTKGVLLVFAGKPQQAAGLLESAAAEPGSDPRYAFHLAVAYFRLGEIDKARASFERARKQQLADQILTESDRKFLQELQAAFAQPQADARGLGPPQISTT